MISPSTVPFSANFGCVGGALGFTSMNPSPAEAFLNEYTKRPMAFPSALMREAEKTIKMMTTSMMISPVPMPPMTSTVPQPAGVRNSPATPQEMS